MSKAACIGAVIGGLIGLLSLLFDSAFTLSADNAGQLGETSGFVIGRVAVSALLGAALFWIAGVLAQVIRRLAARSRQ
ncbi:hypothetical protein [uncultured Nitratireductor sp.]|uniref:hypothetical protein n=1 Tax=uncultured Nitratireductor sp. TaxID=520953 RepID=UPI0025D93F4C|nr:hypothetical protein [uncultured Nitratireductor sp.]